jgi:thymidylate synthase (FAD)
MNVRLISYSQPAPGINAKMHNLQELVAFCARVSNPANQMNNETSEKLLKYLIKHKHWSPFEMVSICMEIETTRDIARQILRHRSFSFQEFSQRYADPTFELDCPFEFKEARLQDPKNRQNSITLDWDNDEQYAIGDWFSDAQNSMHEYAFEKYQEALARGIAKEQARAFFPEGLTKSKLYMNGTLRSWIHYIEIRSGVETQKEHRDVAIACAEQLKNIFPMIAGG